MALSTTRQATLPLMGGFRFDSTAVIAVQGRRNDKHRPWTDALLRRGLAIRGPAHALLADADGVWSWSPHDSHASAARHGSLQRWIETHPGRDARLWISADLMRSLECVASEPHHDDITLRSNARRAFVAQHGEGAAAWPLAIWKNTATLGVCALAGIDLEAFRHHAGRHGVRMQSVVPWWHHAFLEAKRCVHKLNSASQGRVCVVEGRQIAWIATAHGLLNGVQQRVLEEPSVDALSSTIQALTAQAGDRYMPTVVLGQGLSDGAATQGIDALVLGRLDGDQPPQWLRPSSRVDVH